MNYKIRRAFPDDIPEIINLCAEHAEYEGSSYTSEGKAEKLSSFLFSQHPRLSCIVAESNNTIVGYATYMLEFSTWDAGLYMHMDCVYLREQMRGLGIGEALINKIIKEAKSQGCNLIQWQTPESNERAIKFYYRMGATSKKKLRMYLEVKE